MLRITAVLAVVPSSSALAYTGVGKVRRWGEHGDGDGDGDDGGNGDGEVGATGAGTGDGTGAATGAGEGTVGAFGVLVQTPSWVVFPGRSM